MGDSGKCVAIIGCGVMGSALLRGWLRQESNDHFAVYTRTAVSATKLEAQLKTENHQNQVKLFSGDQISQCVDAADIVLFGFLPGDIELVLRTPELGRSLQGKVIVSLLAGVATTSIRAQLAANAGNEEGDWLLVRVIPTIAASIGQSATLIAVEEPARHDPGIVDELFHAIGTISHIPERLMNEATAVGAAIHALAIVAVDSATDASVTQGMGRSLAAKLVVQSLQSAVGLLLKGDMDPASMKSAMSTPGGITINAILGLDSDIRSGVGRAVVSAVHHTRAIG